MRNDKKYFGYWALPGGKIEDNETLMEALTRECTEEIGFMPEYIKLSPVEKFTTEFFNYHTFFCLVEDEFQPVLNSEHIGYSWIGSSVIPKPLHPGFWSTLKTNDVFTKIKTVTKIYTSQLET